MLVYALVFVLGEVLAVFQINIAACLFFVPVFIFIKVIIKPGNRILVMTFLCLISGFILMEYSIEKAEKLYALEEQKVTACGDVISVTENDYGYSIFLNNAVLFYDGICLNGDTVPGSTDTDSSGNGIKCSYLLITTDYDEGVCVGDTVTALGEVSQFSTSGNPGNFDRKAYYKSLGCFVYVSDSSVSVLKAENDILRGRLAGIRSRMADTIDAICDSEYAGIFKAVILGIKSDLDEEVQSLYKRGGISHLLAISGLHISLIGLFVYKLLRRRFLFVTSGGAAIVVIVCFGIMTGAGISTVRAVIMFSIRIFADILGRTYDILSALSFAAILILLNNPFAIYNSSFQMSFGAVIGAGIVKSVLDEFLKMQREGELLRAKSGSKKLGIKQSGMSAILETVLFSMSINLVLNPIISYNYFELPTYSIFLNIIVIPFMSIVLASGIFGTLAGLVNVWLGSRLILPGCIVLLLYEKLCILIDKIPYSTVITGRPAESVMIVYYTLLILFLTALHSYTLWRNKRTLKKEKYLKEHFPKEGIEYREKEENRRDRRRAVIKASFVTGMFLCLTTMLYIHNYSGLYVTFMDVGQGDGIFIRNANGNVYTIDGGSSSVTDVGKYRIIPYLKCMAVSEIDYAFITHMDSDHISGIEEILNTENCGITIKNVILPDIADSSKDDAYDEFVELAKEKGANVLYISNGDTITEAVSQNMSSESSSVLSIECLYPYEDIEVDDTNDSSTILSFTYGDFSCLFTGDIGTSQEEYFYDELLSDYTVLKVAHHGSRNSSSEEFLQKVSPLISVISCGFNNLYGHPHDELLERLESSTEEILRTDLSGAVSIWTDGEKMRID